MQTLDLEKLLLEYQQEIKQDIMVDELSLKDKIMIIPTLKHKWVARLMAHKAQIKKLTDVKKKKIKEITDQSPIALSKHTLNEILDKNEDITIIQDNIGKLETIIEYLEKVEKLIGTMTWDCKNLIDLQKLETT
jgi:Recombination, repair and ssDNA binding protein UvsY